MPKRAKKFTPLVYVAKAKARRTFHNRPITVEDYKYFEVGGHMVFFFIYSYRLTDELSDLKREYRYDVYVDGESQGGGIVGYHA